MQLQDLGKFSGFTKDKKKKKKKIKEQHKMQHGNSGITWNCSPVKQKRCSGRCKV